MLILASLWGSIDRQTFPKPFPLHNYEKNNNYADSKQKPFGSANWQYDFIHPQLRKKLRQRHMSPTSSCKLPYSFFNVGELDYVIVRVIKIMMQASWSMFI